MAEVGDLDLGAETGVALPDRQPSEQFDLPGTFETGGAPRQ